MNMFTELSSLLCEQLENQTKLLELENDKTEVIVKGDTKALDNLVLLQQPYIMSASNFEKQRIKMQNELGLDGITLRRIIEEYPDAKILESEFEKLADVIMQLKKVSAKNFKILNSKLDVVNCILTQTGVTADKPVVYTNSSR